MDLTALGDHADAIAKIVGAVLAVSALWKWGRRPAVCAWGRVRAVWHGLERLGPMQEYLSPDNPEGVPARIAEVLKQGEARGQALAEQGQQLSRMDKKIDAVANTQRAAMNTNPHAVSFEADHEGRYILVNRTFLRWTGLPPSELLGLGWINAIHPDDRARVRQEWASSVADTRRFECRFRLINATTGVSMEVDSSADPVPEGTVPAERWVGTMYRAQAVAAA